jgi:phospholipid methyltransferase
MFVSCSRRSSRDVHEPRSSQVQRRRHESCCAQRARDLFYAFVRAVVRVMGGVLLARLACMFLKGPTLAALNGARGALATIVQLSAGMSGLFLTKLTRLRVGVSAASVLVWLALAAAGFHPSLALALVLFTVLYILRFSFLFLSFVPGGFAPWLTGRYGREQGFAIYEAVTAVLFFFRGLAFIWLLDASYVPVEGAAGAAFATLGALWAVIGTLINLWAAQTVGLDTYYYRDLFMGERHLDFKREGPYEFMDNPMYGLGQLTAYGAALMALSPIGVFATALNQITMYAFNWLVEQPHVRAAQRISRDDSLRVALATNPVSVPEEWNFAPNTPRLGNALQVAATSASETTSPGVH